MPKIKEYYFLNLEDVRLDDFFIYRNSTLRSFNKIPIDNKIEVDITYNDATYIFWIDIDKIKELKSIEKEYGEAKIELDYFLKKHLSEIKNS